MAVYNVNQNRQFYVVKEVISDAETFKDKIDKGTAKVGDTLMCESKDKKQIWFKHVGKGGLTRTDIIDVDKICYATLTTHAAMQRKLKKATVTLSADVNGGLPIAGQDYVLRIQVNNYLAPGDAAVLIKSAVVHATKAMAAEGGAEAFYKKMAESLTMNFSRDPQPLLEFKGTADGVTITEVGNQPWRLGILSQEAVNFEVIPTVVRYEGEDVIWGTVEMGEAEGYVGNGKQIADLEYFCSAERGDMFRNMGYPNNIDVKMMVDPDKEYDVLDIHYFFSGNGVQVHKSEKDITFVSTDEDKVILDDIVTKLRDLGIIDNPE